MNRLTEQQLTWDNVINPTLAPPPENTVIEQQGPRTPRLRKTLKINNSFMPSNLAKRRLFVRVKAERSIPIQVDDA